MQDSVNNEYSLRFKIMSLGKYILPPAKQIDKGEMTSDYNGGGLSLIFPRSDLGFVYGLDKKCNTQRILKHNTVGRFCNELHIGGRLPHCWLHVLEKDVSIGKGTNSQAIKFISSIHLHLLHPSQHFKFLILVTRDSVEEYCIRAALDALGDEMTIFNVISVQLSPILNRKSDLFSLHHRSLQAILQVPV